MSKKNTTATGFEAFTDDELRKAVKLMVRPEWLRDRQTMIAVLESQDFTPEDVRAQLDAGTPLNDGPIILI